MASCPGCNRTIPEGARFCPNCGRETPRPAPESAPGATAVETVESPSSRAPSTPSLHGRFEPGARLGARYRIVGRLGRGGMGEVYRADDLELGQSVALKFLPEKVSQSPSDLARLRQEVRIARQVAHPNVCRTYDISEADGQVFVVMEYIDGEDLSSVLRRLGRPSPDKALEIARQLCLGLGAAHENGVLHRDLKPANIMIDGRGRVRITDFGLAGTAAEIAAQGAVAGTPGYMAPEQRHSAHASVQSDIYSLGLVLYEVFTGKRAWDVTPRPDPARASDRGGTGSDSSVRTPSSLVGDIDPAVERVILRCLEVDPARRPHSAYAVFGALPGGDPLAAAVAAGETPSPELVANAGVEGRVRPLFARLALAAVLAGFFVLSLILRPFLAGLDRPAGVLSVRAEEILTQATGRAAPRHSAYAYRYEPETRDSTARHGDKRILPKQFWRRWSPVSLQPTNIHVLLPTLEDPPQTYPGSGSIVMDPAGRLLALSIVPHPTPGAALPARIDWDPLLRAAGREPSGMAPAPTPASFVTYADTVIAWRASPEGAPETTLVAAGLFGRIVQFETYAGESRLGDLAVRGERPEPTAQDWAWVLIINVIPLVGSTFLAIRNLRARRADVRGALVIGIASTVIYMIIHMIGIRPTELGLFEVLNALSWYAPLAHSLLHGVTLALAYLAVEPYARRLWPGVLVSWARIVAGRLRDPIVGRDILIGGVLAILCELTIAGADHVSRQMGILTGPVKFEGQLVALLDSGHTLQMSLIGLATAIVRATTFFTVLLILRFVLRSNLIAAVAATLVYTGLLIDLTRPLAWPMVLATFVVMGVSIFVTLRYGLVTAIAAQWFLIMCETLPWAGLSEWFAPQVALSWTILGGLLLYGMITAVGGQSLFVDPLGEPARRPSRAGPAVAP